MEPNVTKIVYNVCFGGFGISQAAWERYVELGGKAESGWDIERTDPILVQVVEEMGKSASGSFADLHIADLPAGTKYRIDEYDGSESVMTIDDYEWSVA